MIRRVDTFTVCQPGLEAITLDEVTRLGVQARATHGGVIGSMTWAQVALANLHLRTATRVLVRLGRFDATDFNGLSVGLRRIDWGAWLAPDADVEISVASVASKLYHTGAIEERVREVVGFGGGAPQRLSVRIANDLVILSLDSSGSPLYMRGWRDEAVDAPIRESLAAALVLWSGWDGKAPLVDPCCGSGTIAIEAAMWARRIAPGRNRGFAVQEWPAARSVDWDKLLDAAAADERPLTASISASDVDTDAVAVALRNAERAGVSIDLRTVDAASRANEPRGAKPGWVVTNPPYGNRVGGDLKAIYGAIGRLADVPWHLAVVAAQGSPTNGFGRDWSESLLTRNGGIPVRFLKA